MVTQNPIHLCWICGKSVDVRSCKTEEHGQAVHEACYTAKLALERTTKAPASTAESH